MTLAQLAAGIVALAAFLGAAVYLYRVLRRLVRWAGAGLGVIRAMWRLVDQELNHNHGTSIKDDVYGIAVSVGKLSRSVDQLSHDLYRHLAEKEQKSP